MVIGMSFKGRTMKLGEFLRKTELCLCCCSSLAYAIYDSRLTSDAFIAHHSEQLLPASRATLCCSPSEQTTRCSELPSEKDL